MCGGPRQFVGARARLNQLGNVTRVTWTSVFSNMAGIEAEISAEIEQWTPVKEDNNASISWKFSLDKRKYHRNLVRSSFPSSSIRLLYTPCSFRLVIQFLTHVVLVLLLRRLFILRRKVEVNKLPRQWNRHRLDFGWLGPNPWRG